MQQSKSVNVLPDAVSTIPTTSAEGAAPPIPKSVFDDFIRQTKRKSTKVYFQFWRDNYPAGRPIKKRWGAIVEEFRVFDPGAEEQRSDKTIENQLRGKWRLAENS